MRFARKTGWAFLMALLFWSGIAAWSAWHPDACFQYLHGDTTQMSTQEVDMAGMEVYVPCRDWYPRQSTYMQGACLAGAMFTGLFVLLFVGDVVNWRRARLGLRRVE